MSPSRRVGDRGVPLSILVAVLAGTAAAQVPFVGVNAGAPIWGGSILFTDALAADMASAGCHFVRINFRLDGNTSWTSSLLAQYDTIIQTAKNHNLQVLGLIASETVWANQPQWNENYNTTGINSVTTAFTDNAYLLINRYKADIKRFEIWNEPDCWSVPPDSNPLNPGGFYIWPKNYANLLAETYKKCINLGGASFFTTNGVSLVTGGLFSHDLNGAFATGRDYFTSVYSQTAVWTAFQSIAGRRYPWDYFGYHFYLSPGSAVSTTELASYFNDIRAMKSAYNDSTRFMVTEFGWAMPAVTAPLQAANLRDTYNWLRTQSDVVSAFWYQWNDGDSNGNWGLVYSIGNHKPSYTEFASQCAINPPPTAGFSASLVSGAAPLTVQFTDTSSGQIDTYAWTFGDSQSSSAHSPSHVYQNLGVYTVTLTVTNAWGSNTLTQTNLISVSGATVPADLDHDGDVDLDDLALFLSCATGSGLTNPPPGCGKTLATLPSPTVAWEGAASIPGLSRAIAANDLINGMTGVVEAGGFHSATPGGTAGGLTDLTDGVAGTAAQAVLSDYPGGDPPNSSDPLNRALQVRYDFPTPRAIDHIYVFADNECNPGCGRVFQDYDVQYSLDGDSSFRTLVAGVTTGPFGRSNAVPNTSPSYLGATLTRITGSQGNPIAQNVDSLRFIFYPVSQLQGLFVDRYQPGETGDTDGQREAFESSIIKEIDVFGYTGPAVMTGNIADLDGDGDVDQADFGLFQRCFSGPAEPVDPNCTH